MQAKDFLKLIKALSNKRGDLKIENNLITFKDKGIDITNAVTSSESIEAPSLEVELLTIDLEELIIALKECKTFQAPKSSNREIFKGVCIKYKHINNSVDIVALDRYRAYLKKYNTQKTRKFKRRL